MISRVFFIAQAYFFDFIQIFKNTLSFSVFLNRFQKDIYFFEDYYIILNNINITNKEDIIQIILYIVFIALLFFIGYKLNTKGMHPSSTKKHIEILVQEIISELMQIESAYRTSELHEFIHSVECLKEKLYSESDFGYGNTNVIDCEKEIESHLMDLIDEVPHILTGDVTKNINRLNTVVIKINALLLVRCELKKK